MIKNSSELQAIRQVRASADQTKPSDFELHTRSGEIIPFSIRYSDLPRLAAWLGFLDGDLAAVADRLHGWHHFEGFVLDMDPPPDISIAGDAARDEGDC